MWDRLPLLIRVGAGFLVAPLGPALIASIAIAFNPVWGLFACILICPALVIVGTPLYFLLHRQFPLTARIGVVVGGLLGLLPAVWLITPGLSFVSYGRYTTADAIAQVIALTLSFCLGALGGLIFCWIVMPGASLRGLLSELKKLPADEHPENHTHLHVNNGPKTVPRPLD